MNTSEKKQEIQKNQVSIEEYEKQQNEIIESLKYASYIQQALLPTNKDFKRHFPEHFIYHQPRDIVSGDFYYVNSTKKEAIVAVADCTGHGVPGAFMSILGITFLNEIIHKTSNITAGTILNYLREHIMKALCQTGQEAEQKDGIDMALCVLHKDSNKLGFAGAFNPVYIIRDGTFIELQGDKMPVGIAAEEEKPFSTQYFDLKDNDQFYLFSDGFADQFGGPLGKKFKYKAFRNLIKEISTLPMSQQKKKLKSVFNDWKGNLKQLDDVLVLGCNYQNQEISCS